MRIKKQNKTKVDLDSLDIRETLNRLGVRIKDDRGDYILAFCCFHADGDTPNLSIKSDSGGHFHCFSCGKNGNIFTIAKHVLKADNKATMDFLAGIGDTTHTAESIRRLLDNRSKNTDVNYYVSKMFKHVKDLSALLIRPPGLTKTLKQAEVNKDVDMFFALNDPVFEMLRLMVEDLGERIEDYRFTMKYTNDVDCYDDFKDEVKMIWNYAIRVGYFVRYPKRYWWCIGSMYFGRHRRMVSDWQLPVFVVI